MTLTPVDISVGRETTILNSEVTARALSSERLATVEFRYGGLQLRLPMFSEVSGTDKSPIPIVSALEGASLLLVCGATTLVVFDLVNQSLAASVRLHRDVNSDVGWHSLQVLASVGAMTVVVYEGGVVALDDAGRVRWHRSKFWDDILQSADESTLTFFSDTGGTYRIAVEDGAAS